MINPAFPCATLDPRWWLRITCDGCGVETVLDWPANVQIDRVSCPVCGQREPHAERVHGSPPCPWWNGPALLGGVQWSGILGWHPT